MPIATLTYLFTWFLYLSGQNELIQQGIDFIEVEHDIQFTHVAKVLVQQLDK